MSLRHVHACLSCSGKGERVPSVASYDFTILPEPAGTEVRTTPTRSRRPVRCSGCRGTGLAGGHRSPTRRCPACRRIRDAGKRLVDDVRPFLRPATFVRPKSRTRSALPPQAPRFGGRPYAEAGDRWPFCAGCRSPLTFVGQFAGPMRSLLVFFYCIPCRPWGLEHDGPGLWLLRRYDDAMKAGFRLLRLPPGGRLLPARSVAATSGLSLPDFDELERRDPRITRKARGGSPDDPRTPYRLAVERLAGDLPITTQVGGYARWIQDGHGKACPICGDPMDLVLQVDGLALEEVEFGISGLAYLTACPRHPETLRLDVQST